MTYSGLSNKCDLSNKPDSAKEGFLPPCLLPFIIYVLTRSHDLKKFSRTNKRASRSLESLESFCLNEIE